MKRTTSDVLPVRRLVVQRSGASEASSELEVGCPLVAADVSLQRCAFCKHGQGLLLDPTTNGLTLQCTFEEERDVLASG